MLFLDVYNPALKRWLDQNLHLDEAVLVDSMVKAKYSEAYAQAVVGMAKREYTNKRVGAGHPDIIQTQAPSKAKQDVVVTQADTKPRFPVAGLGNEATSVEDTNADRWVSMPGDENSGFLPHVLNSLSDTSNWICDAKGNRYPIACLRKDMGILQVLNVISDTEAQAIIEASRSTLRKSEVIVEDLENGNTTDDRRDSLGGYVHPGFNAVVDAVDQRLSDIFGHPKHHGESIQVLNYQPGGKYQPHLDYFQSNTAYGAGIVKKSGNRVVTILLYLNDVSEGGSTSFPKHGVQIKPIKGSALYFEYYSGQRGCFDRYSLHAGDPVIQGEKWVATRWVHSKPWV